ncbi:MAG: ATP-binding protein [Oscillochloridaceae bacterium umkhey_bin13]
MTTFPDLLRRYRRLADLTQEQLAEAAGCAVTTLRAIEAGRRRPSRDLAEHLARALALAEAEREPFVRLARLGDTTPDQTPGSQFATLEAQLVADEQRRFSVPTPPARLIGRRTELMQIKTHLADPAVRLVTIVGPGGIGKTRLALQAATDLGPQFAHGAVLVPLGAVAAANLVPGAIADALGLTLSGAAPPEADLLTFLRPRELLLLLDNLEQLLVGSEGEHLVAQLTTLLAQAPGLRLLATSRERLRMRDEWVIELDGLALPSSSSQTAMAQADAAALFVERARQAGTQILLNAENRRAVLELCQVLDGMPLGLELAAAWAPVLSCPEIVREIRHNQDLLASSARDVPDRHRSLQAVFDYSWSLLNADERRALRRLAVFRGPFSRDAAIAVFGAEATDARQAMAMLPMLASLVDKSLLRSRPAPTGGSQYSLHEQIRQYAEAQLRRDPDEYARACRDHACYYARWLQQLEGRLKSAEQREVLMVMAQALANLRAAWAWAISHRAADQLIQLLYTFGWFAEIHGHNPEFAQLAARGAAALADRATHPAATRNEQLAYWLLVSLEGWASSRTDPVRAIGLMHFALPHLHQLGDMRALFQGLITPAYVAVFVGDQAKARALLAEAIMAAREANFFWGEATALVVLGVLEVLFGEIRTAQQQLAVSLAAARVCGDPRHVALALNYSGRVALALGELDQAEQFCREALTIGMAQRDRYQTGLGLLHLGQIAQARSDYPTAAWLFDEALSIAREISDRWLEAQTLGAQARLVAVQNDPEAAATLLRTAIATAQAAPPTVGLDLLADLADLQTRQRPAAAACAYAFLHQHPLTRPATRARAVAAPAETADVPTTLPADLFGL